MPTKKQTFPFGRFGAVTAALYLLNHQDGDFDAVDATYTLQNLLAVVPYGAVRSDLSRRLIAEYGLTWAEVAWASRATAVEPYSFKFKASNHPRLVADDTDAVRLADPANTEG